MSYGVGGSHSSDLVLQWLWCRLVAKAATGPLDGKFIYATYVGPKKKKKKKRKRQVLYNIIYLNYNLNKTH